MKEGKFGDIIRIKGVIQMLGKRYELHYSNGDYSYVEKHYKGPLSIVAIGSSIDAERLEMAF